MRARSRPIFQFQIFILTRPLHVAQSALQPFTPVTVVLVHVQPSTAFNVLRGVAYMEELFEVGHRQPFQFVERTAFPLWEFQRVVQRDHLLRPFVDVLVPIGRVFDMARDL